MCDRNGCNKEKKEEHWLDNADGKIYYLCDKCWIEWSNFFQRDRSGAWKKFEEFMGYEWRIA